MSLITKLTLVVPDVHEDLDKLERIERLYFGEADRIVTIFTKEYGKMRLMAKGIRKKEKRSWKKFYWKVRKKKTFSSGLPIQVCTQNIQLLDTKLLPAIQTKDKKRHKCGVLLKHFYKKSISLLTFLHDKLVSNRTL